MAPPDRMRLYLSFGLVTSLLLTATACSSKDNPAVDAPQAIDAPANVIDSPPGTPDSPPPDAHDGFQLTIDNQLNWCAVTVNGTVYTPPTDFPATFYAKDTVVTLHAAPVGSFVWGFWIGTDGQLDGGTEDHSQDATITMKSDKAITVCCPISGQPTCP